MTIRKRLFRGAVMGFLLCVWGIRPGTGLGTDDVSALRRLIPELSSWKLSEEPESYRAENLFEYINGAAEIYISYEFEELLVANLTMDGTETEMSIEIYDMGSSTNAFGIYSAERYPENVFVPIGTQGYIESGALNFLASRYYIKLLCFEGGEDSDTYLRQFGEDMTRRIGGKMSFPDVLKIFPKSNRIDNSEKYFMRNFMGYSFFHDGYSADYRLDGHEFVCILVVGKDDADAREMLEGYLKAKQADVLDSPSGVHHIRDRYYHNIFLARINHYLCGVMKIQDDRTEDGRRYLEEMTDKLKKK